MLKYVTSRSGNYHSTPFYVQAPLTGIASLTGRGAFIMPMLNDLDLIIREYPEDFPYLHVYAIGDVHVGSPQFDERAIKKKIRIIQEDPYAAVVVCGDAADLGLKNAKTNIYQATMSIRDQLEYVYELFLPITDKIAACVPGNHEERITREVGTCPMYDLCVRWGIQDVYRENVAITKYMFGTLSGSSKRNAFIGITTHGSTRNKHKKFIASFDGIDFAISGHTHTPEYSPHGKIRVNARMATANHVAYKEIVVDATLSPGGYSIKKEYEVAPPPELQYLELTSYRDTDKQRLNHKVMNYHAIQI